MKGILYYSIITLLLFALYGSLNLSFNDFQNKDVCPKVFNIPACYIVLFFFVLIMLAHFDIGLFTNRLWYYGFLSVPFVLALGGTLTELYGTVICPRTPGGTPMCYISLGMCITLFILKILEGKLN